MVKKIIFLLICWVLPDYSQALQSVLHGYTFQNLSAQEIRHLRGYLNQIQDVSKVLLVEEQARRVVHYIDSDYLRPPKKQERLFARKLFSTRRLQIYAEWQEHYRQIVPSLNEDNDDSWQLHHLVFLRLNGPNEWWNIFPVRAKYHQDLIHQSDQPGELLHDSLLLRMEDKETGLRVGN